MITGGTAARSDAAEIQLPLLHEFTVQRAHAHGDRQCRIVLKHHGRPEEIVPDEREDQHRQCRNRRPDQGQHQVPEDAELIRPLRCGPIQSARRAAPS